MSKQLVDIFNLMSPWTFGTAKLSVLFFYRAVFCGRTFNILSRLTIGIVCLWIVVSFLILLLQCRSRPWIIYTSAVSVVKYCMSGFAIAISVSTTDVFTDLLILIMPVYWVRTLRH